MSWLVKGGISKLSELGIDADKDWNVRGISNIKELALGMQLGDIFQRGDGGILETLAPGPISYELTSSGPGHEIEWSAPPGG